MQLNHASSSVSVKPVVLLDTGAQVSCLRHSVFEKFKLHKSILKESDVQIVAANGTPLENLGTIDLKTACSCYRQGCSSQII